MSSGRTRRLAVKLYGEPPPKGAPRPDRLRYVRRISVRLLAFTGSLFFLLVVLNLALGVSTTWPLVLFLGSVVWGLINIASLTVRIGREEQR
jgi:hypothetical protein